MKLRTGEARRSRSARSVIALLAVGLLVFGVSAAFAAVRHFVGGAAGDVNRVRAVSFDLSGGKNRLVSDFKLRGVVVYCSDDSKFRWPPRGFENYGLVRDIDVLSDDGVFVLNYDSPHPEPKTYHYRVRGTVNSQETKAHGALRVHLKTWVKEDGQFKTIARCDSLPVPWVAHLRRR